jgi:multidrug efflux pump subunit AcrA (membrane-fusion protein)
MTTKAETNGTTDDTPSVLDKLNKEFVSNHKGKTTPKRAKELVAALTAAQSARDKADAAVEAAKDAESAAAAALIREVCGKSKVTIGGNLYSPMTRGARVFFRKESGEAMDLG